MALGTPRFILSALVAVILCGGSLTYGFGWGVPQWTAVFQGALAPAIAAYQGWSVTLGIVAAGTLLIGGSLALSWFRATFDYLLIGLGVLAVLVFIVLGLPAQLIAQVDATVSFVIVGLCALLVAVVFYRAAKDRLSGRFTRRRHRPAEGP